MSDPFENLSQALNGLENGLDEVPFTLVQREGLNSNMRVPAQEAPHLYSLKSAVEHLQDGRIDDATYRALVERVLMRLAAAARELWSLEPQLRTEPGVRGAFERSALLIDQLYDSASVMLDCSEPTRAVQCLGQFERVLAAVDALEEGVLQELEQEV
ncbi:MAG: hypothetical protein AB1758_19020 [Candidatus Eremiobacterota bacterium]